ncbi:hypothetical protein AVEN_67838-1 [Araneus ventricosus]|uniref:Uncharacterized protein n=1 Tax=Araneus ventricosus TaxID=182803 RepID=A0A4Y2NJX1_ARAVE|nr:hypothetical protein AVEN_67838-1 [Araneus ventricosus]
MQRVDGEGKCISPACLFWPRQERSLILDSCGECSRKRRNDKVRESTINQSPLQQHPGNRLDTGTGSTGRTAISERFNPLGGSVSLVKRFEKRAIEDPLSVFKMCLPPNRRYSESAADPVSFPL